MSDFSIIANASKVVKEADFPASRETTRFNDPLIVSTIFEGLREIFLKLPDRPFNKVINTLPVRVLPLFIRFKRFILNKMLLNSFLHLPEPLFFVEKLDVGLRERVFFNTSLLLF